MYHFPPRPTVLLRCCAHTHLDGAGLVEAVQDVALIIHDHLVHSCRVAQAQHGGDEGGQQLL
jgi:hypothetical protein